MESSVFFIFAVVVVGTSLAFLLKSVFFASFFLRSKTGGFDSHQLLCSWKVADNSKPFRIARFTRGFYTHLDLFGGSKMVQYDWLLAAQSGCCRFDPVSPKAWVVFFQRLKSEKSKSCDVLLSNLKAYRVGLCRAEYGYVGLCMVMWGFMGMCRAMYGCVGLCMAMYGCVGICMAM